MQLPTELEEFLLQPLHFDPEFARHLKEREIIYSLGQLQEFAAAGAEVRAKRALMAIPADERRIRCCRGSAHTVKAIRYFPNKNLRTSVPKSSNKGSINNSPTDRIISSMRASICAPKKWLAGPASNHLSDSPAFLPPPDRIPLEGRSLKSVPLERVSDSPAPVARLVRACV